MKKIVAACVLVLGIGGACSSHTASKTEADRTRQAPTTPAKPAQAEELTLNQLCVQELVKIYVKHNLPFSRPASERPAVCDEYIKANGIETKAQLTVALRAMDNRLTELDPK